MFHFLWITYILENIRTVWHIKTWYSSKCPNTCKSKNIPGGKIVPGGKTVLIPPYVYYPILYTTLYLLL